jgi:hypothetical protein
MTNGGPANSTSLAVFYIYQHTIAVYSLYPKYFLRGGNNHCHCAPLPFDGWFCFCPSSISRSRDDISTIFSTFLVSLQVIVVPLFILVQKMGMVNTYAGLIIPVTFNAFGIFLLRQFYLGIPIDLQEAAIIDGASYWSIYWNIMLPLSRPILSALAVFFFLVNWNAFLWPLTITTIKTSGSYNWR